MSVRELSPSEWQAFMSLLSERPDLTPDRLRELVEAPGPGRRPRPLPVRPRSATEVRELYEAKIITRVEARKYLGQPNPRRKS